MERQHSLGKRVILWVGIQIYSNHYTSPKPSLFLSLQGQSVPQKYLLEPLISRAPDPSWWEHLFPSRPPTAPYFRQFQLLLLLLLPTPLPTLMSIAPCAPPLIHQAACIFLLRNFTLNESISMLRPAHLSASDSCEGALYNIQLRCKSSTKCVPVFIQLVTILQNTQFCFLKLTRF